LISKAWKNHKFDVLEALRVERAIAREPWAPEEMERLKDIYISEYPAIVDTCHKCSALKFPIGPCPACG